jgi:hypothetical protein
MERPSGQRPAALSGLPWSVRVLDRGFGALAQRIRTAGLPHTPEELAPFLADAPEPPRDWLAELRQGCVSAG